MTQAETLTILKTGANVFLTGEPGSGKTHTINQYIAYLRSCGIEPAITASTGIAATHIGGLTIHSWSGVGIRRELSAYDLDFIGQNRNIARRVGGARILIIDEVSMLSARTLTMIDMVCREIRQNIQPFGGLQVILVGDFFQLPPVNRGGDDEGQEQFAFTSLAWSALNLFVCYLSEQHRQEDVAFLELLTSVRRAEIKECHRDLLRARYSSKPKDGITQLYSHNADVDEINNAELLKLAGSIKIFEMESRGSEKLVAALKRGCLSPEKLLLKSEAYVIFTKNDVATHQYVNGTIGRVTGFAKDNGWPIIKTNAGKIIFTKPNEWRIEDNGRVLARITQIPLRLAWAITIHKSQGMSLDAAYMDLSASFEYGQGYVALSRVRTLAGLSLAGLNQRALEVHPEIIAKDVEFHELSQKIYEIFSKMAIQELQTMHNNFIGACGGKLGVGKATISSKKAGATYDATKRLVLRQLSLKNIAKERKVTIGTIIGHLEKLVAENNIDLSRDLAYLKPDPRRFKAINSALETVCKMEAKKMLLSPTRALLGKEYSYDEIRLVRLFVLRKTE